MAGLLGTLLALSRIPAVARTLTAPGMASRIVGPPGEVPDTEEKTMQLEIDALKDAAAGLRPALPETALGTWQFGGPTSHVLDGFSGESEIRRTDHAPAIDTASL